MSSSLPNACAASFPHGPTFGEWAERRGRLRPSSLAEEAKRGGCQGMSDPGFIPGNPDSPVAICTLSSVDLLEALRASPVAARVSIIGPLATENIGIERMLTSLLERPRIRWLVVCGDERRGPYQAQALHSLFEHGV